MKTISGDRANNPFAFVLFMMLINILYELFFLLELCAPIKVHILFAKQFYWHVIDGIDFFFQYDGLKKRVNARIALKEGMLGNEKRDTATSETVGILADHVISHDLYVTPISPQQKVTHDMCFGT